MRRLIKRLTYGGAACAVVLAFLFAAVPTSAHFAPCPPDFTLNPVLPSPDPRDAQDHNGDRLVCVKGGLPQGGAIIIDNHTH